MFLGCIAKDSNDSSENIILLDHKEVLSNDEINEVTRGNSNLYQHNATGEELKETSIKKTYITFSLGNQFAVDINEVREVIECPDELLQPPGLAKQFHGVLNLRGDMVAIVDSRKLYQLPPTKESSSSESKVLIFETDGTKYGLVVDSVNSIVQFGDSDKIKLPELLYRDSTGKMAEDVEDAVEIETQDNERKTLLVLQMSSVSNRIAA